MRELVKKACVQLRAPQLPPAWAQVEAAGSVRCTAKVQQIGSLMESVQKEVPEFRRAQGLAYPVPGLICLMVMAAAQGVVRGPQDLADYADTLSEAQLRALKFRTPSQCVVLPGALLRSSIEKLVGSLFISQYFRSSDIAVAISSFNQEGGCTKQPPYAEP